MSKLVALGLLVVVMAGGTVAGAGETKVNIKNTWNLEDLYPTREAFDAARAALGKRLPELELGRGTLASGPAALLAVLERGSAVRMEMERLGTYSSCLADEDLRVPENMAARQEIQQLATELGTRAAWIAPEILALPAGTIASTWPPSRSSHPSASSCRTWSGSGRTPCPRPRRSCSPSRALSRRRPTRPTASSRTPTCQFPTVTLKDGSAVRLDQAAYTKYRASDDRDDRIKVFAEFWKTFKDYERTFGVLLDANVKRDLFYAKARNYPSCLASALDDTNAPEAVYHTLIAEANRALPTLHRAFRLRGRMLGIKDLAYHDIYPQLVPSLKMEFPIDAGKQIVPGRGQAARRAVRQGGGPGVRVALDGRLSRARASAPAPTPPARSTAPTRSCS